MPSSLPTDSVKSARSPRRFWCIVLPLIGLAMTGSCLGADNLDETDLVLPSADGTVFSAIEVAVEAGPVEQVTAVADVCSEADEGCREALRNLRKDRLGDIDLDIRVSGQPGNDYPCECRLEGETYQPRAFARTTFTWKAAGYCHKPLYFEDWNLERYGHSHGWADPIISGVHFFATLPVLPYKMGVELPWECIYPLGYYRPGSCAPWTVPAVPISRRGLMLEAATVTGLVFLLP